MRSRGRSLVPIGVWILVMTVMGPATLGAQARRDSLISRAKDEFDGARRIQLLIGALDPSLGGTTGAWGDGVQALAQALLDDGQAPAAATWLRWATRLAPSLEADTIQYTPQVAAALKSARDYVNATTSPGDSLVTTTWLWPTPAADRAISWIQVDSVTVSGAEVSVEGSRPLGRGGRVQVAPGSRQVLAAAAGHDSVRVTREALPGATALLRIRLTPVRPNVSAVTQPNRLPATGATVKKKKFPWLLVALGAAGAGTAVLLLGGGGESSSGGSGGTGGITFTFPDP